jgi:hypothetical protein
MRIGTLVSHDVEFRGAPTPTLDAALFGVCSESIHFDIFGGTFGAPFVSLPIRSRISRKRLKSYFIQT